MNMPPRDIEARAFVLAASAVRWVSRRSASAIERDLIRQFVRATTSIGANLEEARAAETKPDFIHQGAVARKECLEALYWARLLLAQSPDGVLHSLARELDEVASILTVILRRSRNSTRRG